MKKIIKFKMIMDKILTKINNMKCKIKIKISIIINNKTIMKNSTNCKMLKAINRPQKSNSDNYKGSIMNLKKI